VNLSKILFLLSALILSGCGEPLTKSEVEAKFTNSTVTKLSREERYSHLGSNDRSLGNRYIYHSTNGRAYYFKNNDNGYRRKENGQWWAKEDKICYSMRITRAENHDGEQCSSAGVTVAWSSFEKGDTKGLAPRHVSTSRTVTAQANPPRTTQTGRCPGFNVLTGCPGGFYDKVFKAAPSVIAGAAVVGEIGNRVCGSGGCSGAVPSAGASASSATGNSNSSSSNSSSTTTNATSGVRRIEDWGTSPDRSSPQYKITCNNNVTHRYWRQSGEWWGPFGAVGLRNWDINRLANDRCN